MVAQFVRFLATVPLSAPRNGFDNLVIQAINPTETPVSEWDFREGTFGAPEVAAIAAQHIHDDSAYIVDAQWDLWTFESETLKWTQGPKPLEIICRGLSMMTAQRRARGNLAWIWDSNICLLARGILAPGAASNPFDSSDHPIEKTFRQWMSIDANRREYAAKTRENIQQLFSWIESIERALPVERNELSSEGEENFDARLDAILGQR
jgi:hypothetical protein